MIRVALIGAGSLSFALKLVRDILCVGGLEDTEFRLMDLDLDSLAQSTELCKKLIRTRSLPAVIHATSNRLEAISGADYVLAMMRVGGLDALENGILIPLKYGVDQCVGDTLGPSGIFYALRTIPVLAEIAWEMERVAPGAWLFNYANPMAMNCWALRRVSHVKTVGLCHGVSHTTELLCQVLGIPCHEVEITCAGINHQAWFLRILHNDRDHAPRLLAAFERNPDLLRKEKCRVDVLRKFGYFSTESNGHLSEYLPWYRKRPDVLSAFTDGSHWLGGKTGGYLEAIRNRMREERNLFLKNGGENSLSWNRSRDYGSRIIEALEAGKLFTGNFNVQNQSLITNLPTNCTVEVPCDVNRRGIQPISIGRLPIQCAATCRASITVQELAVEAALGGNRDMVKLAVLHDPLTAAVCSTDEVWRLCDELFEADAPWLPQFNGDGWSALRSGATQKAAASTPKAGLA